MKKTKQAEIADYIKMSPQTVCDIRKGRRSLSKKRAKELSAHTGIPFETLALGSGKQVYQALVLAYQQHGAIK